MKKQALFWVAFNFLVSAVFSETVKLKNGDMISGKLWRLTPGFVLVESPYGVFKIPQKFVNAIEFENDSAPRKVFLKLLNGKEFYATFLQYEPDGIHLEQGSEDLKLAWEDILEINFIRE